MKNALKMLGGAIVVYVVMAACGASSNHGDATSAGDDDGSIGAELDGALAALGDAVTNPVGEAAAGPTATVVTEPCNKTGTNLGGTSFPYAEHAFPGKTKADLATLSFTINEGKDIWTSPAGYQTVIGAGAWIKDGSVAVTCAATSTVTFVLPQ